MAFSLAPSTLPERQGPLVARGPPRHTDPKHTSLTHTGLSVPTPDVRTGPDTF
jgi:hypothetical protein